MVKNRHSGRLHGFIVALIQIGSFESNDKSVDISMTFSSNYPLLKCHQASEIIIKNLKLCKNLKFMHLQT